MAGERPAVVMRVVDVVATVVASCGLAVLVALLVVPSAPAALDHDPAWCGGLANLAAQMESEASQNPSLETQLLARVWRDEAGANCPTWLDSERADGGVAP